ncbi:Chitin synthase, class 7 [Entomophthora muscae]|uniref:Chitin synthase, class 7 n=1 Tax=Entomophthora muscae TaxID=34485 RepID=A0ACC2SNN0_9FUNG|nr:Chitin synthase, class 7 [Entomophthora muscae]
MKIGSYSGLCKEAPLSICPLLGGPFGLPSKCYGKGYKVGSLYIFEVPTFIIYLVSWLMIGIMISNIRQKANGIGQKEFITFFYIYFVHLILEALTVSNIIPIASDAYLYIASFHYGSSVTLTWCLFLNSFVIYQFLAAGEKKSVWGMRFSSLAVFVFGTFLAISTFKGWLGLSPLNPTLLWWLHIVFPNVFVVTFFITQVTFVYFRLDNKWPIGDLINSYMFYVISQVLISSLSSTLCEASRHYLDGHFFQALSLLCSVMMLYKYWDSINYDDMEFTIDPIRKDQLPGPPRTSDGKNPQL